MNFSIPNGFSRFSDTHPHTAIIPCDALFQFILLFQLRVNLSKQYIIGVFSLFWGIFSGWIFVSLHSLEPLISGKLRV